MSNIEMACIRLKQALQNKSAQERYTTMMSAKYTHPGWVESQKKHTVRRHANENHI